MKEKQGGPEGDKRAIELLSRSRNRSTNSPTDAAALIARIQASKAASSSGKGHPQPAPPRIVQPLAFLLQARAGPEQQQQQQHYEGLLESPRSHCSDSPRHAKLSEQSAKPSTPTMVMQRSESSLSPLKIRPGLSKEPTTRFATTKVMEPCPPTPSTARSTVRIDFREPDTPLNAGLLAHAYETKKPKGKLLGALGHRCFPTSQKLLRSALRICIRLPLHVGL